MIVLQIIVWIDALFFQATAPHGVGRALCARGGAAPLSPEGFLLHPAERYTHTNSNHKKPLLQLGKNISPTRKIEKAHSCTLLQTIQTLQNRTWYGEGTELVRRRSRLTPFVLFCSNHHFSLFYFVLFRSSCSIQFELLNLC